MLLPFLAFVFNVNFFEIALAGGYFWFIIVVLSLREPWLNLDHDHISYDDIIAYYQLECLSDLPRTQECRSCGKFFNYCELQPANEASRNFLRVINLLRTSKFVSSLEGLQTTDTW